MSELGIRIRTIIMGAAGRDFHNFNVFFRDNPIYEVVAFTATQIPNIEGRTYPAAAGRRALPKGIPIHAESDLVELIQKMPGGPGDLCLQRCAARIRDAQGLHGAGSRGGFPPDGH